MNKTIIINISGVIFHIEEEAYEVLKNYMNDIKRHFSSYQDNFEIVTDIENRIAEMFSELLAKEIKQVIVQEDVNLVISKMGNPSDFETEDDEFNTSSSNEEAHYQRKLFRDVDDRVIGGVCSGIGHYFEIEARWVRVAFFVLFIFYGIGFIPYLLLWIVMPKAKSRTEKMEMKGEKINLQSFQKNIEEELDAVKSNFQKVHENSKPGLSRIGSFIRDVLDGLFSFLRTGGKVVFKIIGFIIIAFVGIGLVAAFIALLVFLGYAGNADVSTIFPLNSLDPSLRPAIYICAFLLIFIPLLSIILFTIRVLFNSKKINRTIGFSMLMIWILSLAVGIYCIAKNATDFKESASFSETIELKSNPKNIYYLQTGEERTVTENILGGDENRTITIMGSDRDFDTPNSVDIDLNLIQNGSLSIVKTYSARGKNFEQALKNAHQVAYYYSQKDSLLTFDYNSRLTDGSLWRDQEVAIKLNVPIGSTVYIQRKLASHFLRNQMHYCLDYGDDSDEYIKVLATEDGFICKKTDSVIERQREYNKDNGIEEAIKETISFK